MKSIRKPFTTIDLLRHGATNTSGLLSAHADEALSKQGFADLKNATEHGNWDVIITSPMQRCHAFAKWLAVQNNCLIEVEKQIKEMDFGRWTGMPIAEIWQNEPEQLKQLWQQPDDFTAPDGESIQDFRKRVLKAMTNIMQKHENKVILIVTHTGVIRAILANALDISMKSALKFSIEYASLSRIHCYPDKEYSLQLHGLYGNDHTHL